MDDNEKKTREFLEIIDSHLMKLKTTSENYGNAANLLLLFWKNRSSNFDAELNSFVASLKDRIKGNCLTKEEISNVVEYFIKTEYENHSDEEMEMCFKYYTMGWYVYSQLE